MKIKFVIGKNCSANVCDCNVLDGKEIELIRLDECWRIPQTLMPPLHEDCDCVLEIIVNKHL